jgi:hypothetical protein
MIRKTAAALLVAGTITTLTCTLGTSSQAQAGGPVDLVLTTVQAQLNGLPHCC